MKVIYLKLILRCWNHVPHIHHPLLPRVDHLPGQILLRHHGTLSPGLCRVIITELSRCTWGYFHLFRAIFVSGAAVDGFVLLGWFCGGDRSCLALVLCFVLELVAVRGLVIIYIFNYFIFVFLKILKIRNMPLGALEGRVGSTLCLISLFIFIRIITEAL